MAVGTWKVYDDAAEALLTNDIDLMNDTLKCAFFTDTLVPVRTDASYSSLTGELPTLNGYTLGGVTLTTPVVTKADNVSTFNAAIAEITASGGSLTAKYGVIYDDTHATKILIACVLLDGSGINIILADGKTFGLHTTLFQIGGGW